MITDDFEKNQDWDWVIPIWIYMARSWVELEDRQKLRDDDNLFKYVMHRLRRTWSHSDTKDIVHKFIEDYFKEKELEK